MSEVTQEYVNGLPDIYKDILSAFPFIEPLRKVGEGLSYQTLFMSFRDAPDGEHLLDFVQTCRKRAYSYQEVVEACQNMERAGVVEIKQKMFVCPTRIGEKMIALLTGKEAASHHVPPFPPYSAVTVEGESVRPR